MSQLSPKIKVAKQGKEIGEFSLWEVKQKLDAQEFLLSYNFWRPGMRSWGKLEDIKNEISNAAKPQGVNNSSGSVDVPPPPPSTLDVLITAFSLVIGLISSALGLFVLLSTLFLFKAENVIQQNVAAIHMTNGILLIILGVLILIFGLMKKNTYLSSFVVMFK